MRWCTVSSALAWNDPIVDRVYWPSSPASIFSLTRVTLKSWNWEFCRGRNAYLKRLIFPVDQTTCKIKICRHWRSYRGLCQFSGALCLTMSPILAQHCGCRLREKLEQSSKNSVFYAQLQDPIISLHLATDPKVAHAATMIGTTGTFARDLHTRGTA